ESVPPAGRSSEEAPAPPPRSASTQALAGGELPLRQRRAQCVDGVPCLGPTGTRVRRSSVAPADVEAVADGLAQQTDRHRHPRWRRGRRPTISRRDPIGTTMDCHSNRLAGGGDIPEDVAIRRPEFVTSIAG